ncbi:hypothetical protein APICC_04633 [Apis cerana cerana]|uniref:Uncharacterized protein n=1 Tax=Apis cerana cerana TaxID=94128 RepID=A0A2A3EN92_APICC|nr:hypothetical protein APICC_04633 [Apis cerana cerana]
MELRSMSKRPPPYTHVDRHRKVKFEEQDDSPPVIVKDECTKFSKFEVLFEVLLRYIKKFEDPCIYVMQKFRSQILNWSSCMNCGPRGSKCLYTLKEPNPNESNIIRATHLASNLRTTETMKIDFEQINKTCIATGESTSNEWFRIFDYGTNYCNLHNLITGIGFDKSLKFLELTSNTVCTQYNMVVCN